jgi:hypothetical protein
MIDFIKLNGVAVRTSAFHRRTEKEANGLNRDYIAASVIVRGAMQHRSLSQLLTQQPMKLEIPNGAVMTHLEVEVFNATHVSTGVGETAAFRHDIQFRETDASATQRTAIAVAEMAARKQREEAARARRPSVVEEEPQDDRLDSSWGKLSTDQSTWMNALKQMKDPEAMRPVVPEPPLTAAELGGIEAVLVGLRLEALITALEEAGVVQRGDIDDLFHQLVMERFINEAAPVVGEKAARRASREVIAV